MPASQYTSYAIPNSMLIANLNLSRHPEGDKALRPLATSIYYLLTPDEQNGVFHMNKSATMHVHHQGRAEYILITAGNTPRVERKYIEFSPSQVIGPNIHAGEVLQLLVPSGVWKMSRLLPEDLEQASTTSVAYDREDARDHTGCLITEVVFPGFAWQDHCFLTKEELTKMWGGLQGVEEWLGYLKQ
ncbi:hypothetical protein IEO21_08610 [Rhodonia placenta]|uniref:DUF985 domain-containing protein n=1 Tax=Rhodonia placenta TaxID=104341 RepID=A0A8H7NW06_9APHY|nr:hypothetical protein IEO21_08610 [Postia placenta]